MITDPRIRIRQEYLRIRALFTRKVSNLCDVQGGGGEPGWPVENHQTCGPSSHSSGNLLRGSVADPNPDPSDPYVFVLPGSGSFCHQAKIVRKTLIPIVLSLLWLFIFEKWCKCKFKSTVINRKTFFKINFLLASWRSMTKIAGCGS